MPGWARSIPRRPGCPKSFLAQLRSRARSLWDRRPRPHPGTGGGVLSPLPHPGAHRDGARGHRVDPRAPARPGRCAGRSSGRGLQGGAGPSHPHAGGPRPGRRGPRPRGAIPRLRRAGHRRRARGRLHRDGGARRRARGASAAVRPRRAHRGARRLPTATRVAPQRAHARGRTAGAARPRRGNGAPLLPGALTRGLRARVHRRPGAADLALSVRGPSPPPRGCLRRARRRRSPR